jgi:hypothetical protein
MLVPSWSRPTTCAAVALLALAVGACGSTPAAPAPASDTVTVLHTKDVGDPYPTVCNTPADCPVPGEPCVLCPDGVNYSCPVATCIDGQCGVDQNACPEPIPCGGVDDMQCPPGMKCQIEACPQSVGTLDDAGPFPSCFGICVKGTGDVGSPCQSPTDCNPGLLCCYPCGVAGCDSVCTVPLDGQCPQFF